MKKIVCLVVAVLMMLTLSACGSKKAQDGATEKLVCGVTIYEPMNYLDANGKWTGFDTEFAQLVGEKLSMEVEFQEIKWENKYMELEAGTITCIWNGFTANASDDGKARGEIVDMSYSYMLNQQCVVVRADNLANFTSAEALQGKSVAAEKGSAGESFALEAIGADGQMIDSAAQIDTFLEVKSGAADCAVVDILLAKEIAGSGNYADLVIADITLDSEVYAVGFAKGNALRDKVNDAMKALFDEGKLQELAKKYGLENSLTLDTSFTGK